MVENQHTVYFELRDALVAPGCAVCALALRSMRRYFDALGYESVNDPGIRNAVRQSRGFCEVHGRMLREARDALGTAIMHRDILTAVTNALGDTAYQASSLSDLLRHAIGSESGAHGNGRDHTLEPQEPCPACVRRQSTEQTYVDVLMQHLNDAELLPLFRASAGLCLPHLRLALRHAPDAPAFECLKVAQLTIWQRLGAELDEFIRKRDHHFAAEPTGTEGSSWSRAVELVSGQFGLGCAGWAE